MSSLTAVLLAAALSLGGCAGYTPGPRSLGGTALAEYNTPAPSATNDGFYDGGVYDQDYLFPEPVSPRPF